LGSLIIHFSIYSCVAEFDSILRGTGGPSKYPVLRFLARTFPTTRSHVSQTTFPPSPTFLSIDAEDRTACCARFSLSNSNWQTTGIEPCHVLRLCSASSRLIRTSLTHSSLYQAVFRAMYHLQVSNFGAKDLRVLMLTSSSGCKSR